MSNFNENMNEIKELVNKVQDYAEKNKYAYIVPEQMLMVLLSDDKCLKMIKMLIKDETSNESSSENEEEDFNQWVEKKVEEVKSKKVSKYDNKKKIIEALKKEVSDYLEANIEKTNQISDIGPTNQYTKLIQSSISQAAMRSIIPDSLCVFMMLFDDKDQACSYFLNKYGIYEEDVRNYIRNYRQSKGSSGQIQYLAKYATNLNDLARDGKIDPLIGREKEVERVIQVLAKKRSSCPLLLGNAGCGKSAIVEGLALKIVNEETPESLLNKTIYALDLTSMVAGTKFRGEFEDRLENTIKEAASNEDVIVFIDELHTIVGAGSAEGSMDSANILKPYLSRGQLHVIGATTYDEYKNKIEKDKALCRRFKRIDLSEPTKEETFQILLGLRENYEKFHGIKFSDEVLQSAIDLSAKYIIGRFFPDKAIDVIDEIGAKYHSGLKKGKKATLRDVEDVVSAMANIGKITVETDDKEKLKTLGNKIKENLFGQDEAVDKIVRQIRMSKAGLGVKGKPLLSAVLAGPTGTGKTELAKTLAEKLGIGFTKLDMSEYQEEYSVSKLVGSAAGYVGYEQSGALTEPLIQNPNQVILLDEIEKANKSVYDLLLQVLDEGKLTDNHGREASFRNAIVLMTTNVGYANAEQMSSQLGFNETENNENERKRKAVEDAFKKEFSPEFRNRLTDVFYFNPLNDEVMGMIVDKNVRRINEALEDKNIKVKLNKKARKWFVDKAVAEKAGGRPVERFINSEISEKLADEILFGEFADKSGNVLVDCKNDKIELEFKENE